MAVGGYPIAVNPVTGELTYDPLSSLDSELLTTGEIVPRRNLILTNAVAITSGTMPLAYFTAEKSETISTLTTFSGTVAAGATPTLCRMGVYSVATNGDLTLVASTPNDTTLFAATNTAYPKALSATWNKQAGQRYATALLIVSATTMPTLHGQQLTVTNPMNTLVRLSPPIAGRLLGQTDLPGSVSAGSLVGYQTIVAMQMS